MNQFQFIPTTLKCSAVAVALLLSSQAWSQDTAADCDVRIGTGPKGGVYEILAKDIQTACGQVVSVCPVRTQGGLQNLMKLASSDVDIAFAQVDTLQELSSGGDDAIGSLQALMPLHSNLLHILALRKGFSRGGLMGFGKETKVIGSFSDLKGLRIAAVGSAQRLGPILNKNMNYNMEFVMVDSDDEAVDLLRKNQVAAIFTNGGWPMPNVSRHDSSSGLTLVEYDEKLMAPYAVTKRSYQELGAFNIKFLAAPNLLLTRPFKAGGDMGKKVGALQSCLLNRLTTLQEGRFHSAWKEIKTPNNTMGVARFNGDGARAYAVKR